MARPSLLTPETQQRIVTAVTAGSTLKDAAHHAGIAESTLLSWNERGRKARDRDDEPPDTETRYVAFLEAVEKARADAAVGAVATIRRAITGWDETTNESKQVLNRDGEVVTLTSTRTVRKFSWSAAAWFLERSRPAEWGRWLRANDEEADQDVLDVNELRERARSLVRDELARKRQQRASSEESPPSVEGNGQG